MHVDATHEKERVVIRDLSILHIVWSCSWGLECLIQAVSFRKNIFYSQVSFTRHGWCDTTPQSKWSKYSHGGNRGWSSIISQRISLWNVHIQESEAGSFTWKVSTTEPNDCLMTQLADRIFPSFDLQYRLIRLIKKSQCKVKKLSSELIWSRNYDIRKSSALTEKSMKQVLARSQGRVHG